MKPANIQDGPANEASESRLSILKQAVLQLTPAELEEIREWVENLVEDRFEMTDDFKAEIAAGKADVANGRVRVKKV